jgi:hypothetical protein
MSAQPAWAECNLKLNPAPGELSETASGFLLDLANDADDVTRQLAACQQIIISDRQQ